MEADIKIEELDATRRRIAVEVPIEAVQAEMDRAFGRVQGQAKLKGFRPGKAPRSVLEKYFGAQVRADVLSHLIEHSYAEAVERSGLRPAGPPEIVPENIEAGLPLRYTATLDVLPAIAVSVHEGLVAKRPIRAIDEEDVDRALDRLRESLAELRPVEGREEAHETDFVTIDHAATLDGTPLPGGTRQNRLVEIGKGAMPAEIERVLPGARVGQTLSVDVPFPEEHPDKTVAGKTVHFEITLKTIREKILPPADDELAKEHGECETLAALREKLRGRLAESFTREAEADVRDQLVGELIARNSFDVPRSLVERQTDSLVEDLMQRLGPQAAVLTKDAARLEKLREDARPGAERQVRAVLVLDALAGALGLSVADEEVDRRIGEMATQAGNEAQRLLEVYRDPRARDDLRERLRRERALDAVVAAAKIEEVEAASLVAPADEKR